MAQIAEQAEKDKLRENDIVIRMGNDADVREFMAHSAILATEKVGVKGIITDSATGQTARNLAAFRGPTPVLAICYTEKLQRWLNLSYGITPVYQKEQISQQELFLASVRMLRQKGYISDEDKVAYLSGSLGEGGGTSFLEINKVNDIMKRATKYQETDKQNNDEIQ